MSPRPRNTRLAAYGVCVQDGKMLLARWISRRGPLWMVPGGGVDFGEDPIDGVVREVEEETGYLVGVNTLLGIDSVVRPDFHGVRVIYEVTIAGGELRHEVGGSTDMAAWFPLDEIPGLDRAELVDTALALMHTRPASGSLAG